ncbi:MAG: polymer-forming cytoskeletal protein [Candidatus Omnitrophica bacterium]|nr:polymer-forming cytoskeletal protein [Candidatus Omnitrophota bacterium]
MFKKDQRLKMQEKIIDIEAGMQGNIKFSSPVNLRISGKFEGELETQGVLAIGEKADVKAKKIKGEYITIAGNVKGDIISSKRLELSSSAKVIGNIKAPILVINEGAMLKGNCEVPFEAEKSEPKKHSKKKK